MAHAGSSRWRSARIPAAASLALAALALFGCMQIETRVVLREDGSVTITEKVRFSRRLLDLSGKPGSDLDIASLLNKEAAQERAKHFGKGAAFVSHEVKEAEGGAREACSVYQIGDIAELHYVSPFAAYRDYPQNNAVKFHVYPILNSGWQGEQAGDIAVALRPVAPPKGDHRPKEGEPPPKGPAPAEVQVFRDLQPMFRDMLKDFKLRLTFEAYVSIRFSQIGMRGRGAAPKEVDFLNFTDKDLDKFGGKFLENEEIMLDILRGELSSQDIADHIRDSDRNLTLPVFMNWGSPWASHRNGDNIFIKPSQHLFKRYLEGKTLNFGERNGGAKPANFDEIGYKK